MRLGGGWNAVPPLVAVGAATAAAGLLLVPPLRTRPPWRWETFGQLARRVAARERAVHRSTVGDDPPSDPGRGAVFGELREILVELFSVPAADITLDARLVEDLRLD